MINKMWRMYIMEYYGVKMNKLGLDELIRIVMLNTLSLKVNCSTEFIERGCVCIFL